MIEAVLMLVVSGTGRHFDPYIDDTLKRTAICFAGERSVEHDLQQQKLTLNRPVSPLTSVQIIIVVERRRENQYLGQQTCFYVRGICGLQLQNAHLLIMAPLVDETIMALFH